MPDRPSPETLRRPGRWREVVAPLAVLVVLVVVIAARRPVFLSADNLRNVVTRNVPLGLVAVAQTMVILCGQIDLSVGSVMALSAVSGALVLNQTGAVGLAVLAALAVGAACGVVNGQITTRAKVPAFIVTLAMMGLARGLALAVTKGQTVSGAYRLSDLVLVEWLGVPLPVWLLLLAGLASWLLLTRTVLGRNLYASGAKPVAARLSGVRVDRNVQVVFVLCGLLVGLAGAIECGRNSSASPNLGDLMELDSIAAVVIGGASLSGGQGTIGGTLLGVTIMAVLWNGCNLLDIANEWQKVIIGPLIVLAVLYDRWLRRRSGRGDA